MNVNIAVGCIKQDFPLNTKRHLKKIFSEFDAIQEASKEALKKKD